LSRRIEPINGPANISYRRPNVTVTRSQGRSGSSSGQRCAPAAVARSTWIFSRFARRPSGHRNSGPGGGESDANSRSPRRLDYLSKTASCPSMTVPIPRKTHLSRAGTESSNPSPSSGESANPRSQHVAEGIGSMICRPTAPPKLLGNCSAPV
jgi:hypothetical protein